MNGRHKLLVGLLVVLALIFGWNRLLPLLTGGDDAGGGGGGRRGGSGAAAIEVVELAVDRLTHDPGAFKPGRDPFRYYQPPPPPPTGPTPEELEARRRAAEAAAAAARAAAEAKPAGPQPPEIDLTYLGSFGPADRRIAVFTDGDEVYNALAGDVLQDQFVVDHIGLESVDLKYVDFPDLPPARLGVGG